MPKMRVTFSFTYETGPADHYGEEDPVMMAAIDRAAAAEDPHAFLDMFSQDGDGLQIAIEPLDATVSRGWRAVCYFCAWVGPWRPRSGEASEDARHHRHHEEGVHLASR